jgi:hypothetical protein
VIIAKNTLDKLVEELRENIRNANPEDNQNRQDDSSDSD